jgi:hypothetical protein
VKTKPSVESKLQCWYAHKHSGLQGGLVETVHGCKEQELLNVA